MDDADSLGSACGLAGGQDLSGRFGTVGRGAGGQRAARSPGTPREYARSSVHDKILYGCLAPFAGNYARGMLNFLRATPLGEHIDYVKACLILPATLFTFACYFVFLSVRRLSSAVGGGSLNSELSPCTWAMGMELLLLIQNTPQGVNLLPSI